jgi:anthranilate phosphoribosyltransferase
VFNLLGPITNPAGATHQVIGVFQPELTRKLADVLALLGTPAAMVVHGSGLDELTVCGETVVSHLAQGEVRDFTLRPEEVGLPEYPQSALVGGDARENAEITRAVLTGRGTPAQRDVVALNAGAGLYLAGKSDDLSGGVRLARDILTSGAAWTILERYGAWTRGEVRA